MDDTATAAAVAPPQDVSAPLRRVIRAVGWTAIWLGLLTIGFVFHQLWITTWISQQNQTALATERLVHFATAEITAVAVTPEGSRIEGDSATVLPGAIGTTGDDIRTGPLVLLEESAPEAGSAFSVIRIPTIERLQEGWNVVEGVRLSDLRSGAGHMPWTPLPGQPGNAVISGHRTTNGAPFHELDELEPGDAIEVETALGVHVYEVRETRIVRPTDVWVTDPRDGAWLTLTTCNPKFSARQRLIVFAELVAGPNFEVIQATS